MLVIRHPPASQPHTGKPEATVRHTLPDNNQQNMLVFGRSQFCLARSLPFLFVITSVSYLLPAVFQPCASVHGMGPRPGLHSWLLVLASIGQLSSLFSRTWLCCTAAPRNLTGMGSHPQCTALQVAQSSCLPALPALQPAGFAALGFGLAASCPSDGPSSRASDA